MGNDTEPLHRQQLTRGWDKLDVAVFPVMSKPILLLVAAVVIVVLGLAIYRSRVAGDGLNVTPQAAKEIEKAKQR